MHWLGNQHKKCIQTYHQHASELDNLSTALGGELVEEVGKHLVCEVYIIITLFNIFVNIATRRLYLLFLDAFGLSYLLKPN